jgi:Tfp pilus assembly protein PilF
MNDKHNKQKHWIEDTVEILGIGAIALGIISLFNEKEKPAPKTNNIQPIKKYLEYSWELRNQQDYKGALENAKTALRLNPNNPHTLNLIALIYIDINQHLSHAEKYLLKAIQIVGENPQYFYLYHNLGDLYHQTNQYALSNNYHKIGLGLLTDIPEHSEYISYFLEQISHNCIFHLNQAKDGIQYLNRLLNIKPERYLTYVDLAEGYFYAFQEEVAIQNYQIAIQKLEQDNTVDTLTKQSEKAEILHRIGYSYAMIDKYERALYHLEEAIKIDANHSLAHLHLALLAAYYNQPLKLKEHLEKAIQLISIEDWYQNEFSNELLEEDEFLNHPECKKVLLDTLLEYKKITSFIYDVHNNRVSKEDIQSRNEEIREQVLKLIGQNNIDEVFEILLKHFAQTNQKDKQEKLSLISGQFHKLTQESIIGIIASEQKSLEDNKIRNNLIQLISVI